MSEGVPEFRLNVSRQALVEALEAIQGFTPEDEALFVRMTHRDGLLTLSSIGVSADIPTPGDWPRLLTFMLANPAMFARKLPPADPILLAFENGKLRIGPTTIAAEESQALVEPAPLSVGMSAFEMCIAVERYGIDSFKAAAGTQAFDRTIDKQTELLGEIWPFFEAFGMTQAEMASMLNIYLKFRAMER